MLTPIEILMENAEKPQGWKFDPRTKEGKVILRVRSRAVADLKETLRDLIDPDTFYTKHALVMACVSQHLLKQEVSTK
ncbi:hypothetical protein SFB10_2481 [Serratia liquefaciens]|nr:hypothetical protein SFB10_2481 [Serratia liquefaciens]